MSRDETFKSNKSIFSTDEIKSERKDLYESDAKVLAGKEKREMEEILHRGVKRDMKINQERDRMLEERAPVLPKDNVKTGADVLQESYERCRGNKINSRCVCWKQ